MHSKAAFLLCLLAWFSSQAAASPDNVEMRDLRAPAWKVTSLRNVGTGVVQHTGDDTKFGNLADLLLKRLSAGRLNDEPLVIEVKTADVRLSLPNAQLDEGALRATQSAVPGAGVLATPVLALLTTFNKDKAASAVFCVSVNGSNYLGNDARLFRFGAEGELSDAVEAALKRLESAVRSGVPTNSPACEPGWEGGQPL